jgi:crotonobetainyl-CoA:carnitine CoA-transferase CaiB-like acyl-CoA transferase
LEAAGVPAGPVLDVKQMHEDPQVLARDMVVEVQHSRLGAVKTIGAPVKFSHTPGAVARGAPTLGEHTRDILRECGYSDHDIDELAQIGVVRTPETTT